MPYKYSLLDDDERASLQDWEALGSGPSPDLRLDGEKQAWLDSELGAPPEPEARARSERFRVEPGPSPWAIVADIVLNRGKNLGYILESGSPANAKQRELELNMRAAQLDRTEAEANDPFSRWIAAGNLHERALSNRTAMLNYGQRGRRLDSQTNPESELAQGAIDIAGQKAAAQTEGRIGKTHEWSPTTNEDAADKERLLLEARGDYAARNAQRANKAAAARARMIAEETGIVDPETGKRVSPAQDVQQRKLDELRAPVPGTYIRDDPAWNAAMMTPGNRQKLVGVVGLYESAQDALEQLIALRKEHGTELFGQAAGEADALQRRIVSAYTQIGHSGVLNAGEWQQYSAMIPNLSARMSDVARLVPGMGDPTLSRLKGLQRSTTGAIDRSLSPWGIGYGSQPVKAADGRETATEPLQRSSDDVTPASAAIDTQQPELKFLGDHGPEDLGITGERRDDVYKEDFLMQSPEFQSLGFRRVR